jgi:hypothetical protein
MTCVGIVVPTKLFNYHLNFWFFIIYACILSFSINSMCIFILQICLEHYEKLLEKIKETQNLIFKMRFSLHLSLSFEVLNLHI